jgi:hypothetical protein
MTTMGFLLLSLGDLWEGCNYILQPYSLCSSSHQRVVETGFK